MRIQGGRAGAGAVRLTDEDRSLFQLCCSLATEAHSSTSSRFLLHRSTHPHPCAVLAFPGAWSPAEWVPSSGSPPFGDCEVDAKVFPSLRAAGCRTPARVSAAPLRAFLRLLADSELQSEISGAMAEERRLLFTGHSFGGAVAVIATIWSMEHRAVLGSTDLRRPSCVTFGSPLVGDGIFNHALNRENWSNCFSHFVTALDIVPRVSLAPLHVMAEEFQAVLCCLSPKTADSSVDPGLLSVFYETLLRSASCASSYQACLFMGCTNAIVETLPSFIDISLFRPSGTYFFLTSGGQPIVLRNKDAVLLLLTSFLQLDASQELLDAAKMSLNEHWQYESRIKQCLTQDDVCLDYLEESPLPEIERLLDGTTIGGVQLSREARLCLHAAGQWEKQRWINQAKIDANGNKIQEAINYLNEYRVSCELRGLSYYDSFKLQRSVEDFNANVKRLELAGLWDEIIEMLRRSQLPDTFEGRKEWLSLGTAYRRLVEPLDIANYYRHSKDEETGSYLLNGRPRRYKYTQNWQEQAHRMPDGSSSESCFWAVVEELRAEMRINHKPFDAVRDRILKLEAEAARWLAAGDLTGDVLLSSSPFVVWWESLPEQHKLESCMRKFIYGEDTRFSNSLSSSGYSSPDIVY